MNTMAGMETVSRKLAILCVAMNLNSCLFMFIRGSNFLFSSRMRRIVHQR